MAKPRPSLAQQFERWKMTARFMTTKQFWQMAWVMAKMSIRWPVAAAAGGFALIAALFWAFSGSLNAYAFNLWAYLLAAVYVVGRHLLKPRRKYERPLFVVALAVLFCAAMQHNFSRQLHDMYGRTAIRTWNMYHYYMGSKYFAEVGYTDLYVQSIIADREDQGFLKQVKAIRDMTDYDVKPVDEIVPEARSPKFTDARWDEFKRDLNVFLPKAPKRVWPNILTDRGYNPTPFWNRVGQFVSDRFDVSQRRQLLAATSLDLVLYALMIGGVWWAFGAEASMLAFLTFALLPFNILRVVGGYLQYDWTAALILGVCFLHKRLPIAAAVSLAYATMARAFPLVLAAGLVFPAARQLLGQRKLDKFYWKFAAAFAAMAALGLFIGGLSGGRGLGGWQEWKEKIGVHNYEMTFGEGRVGLGHIFTHKLGSERFERGTETRKRAYEQQEGWYWATAVVFLALYLAAVWRRGRVNAVLWSMLPIYILLVPSHYYWSILALLPLFGARPDKPWAPSLPATLTALLAPAGWYQYARGQSFQYAQYLRLDWLLGMAFLVFAVYLIVHDLEQMGVVKLPAAPWAKKAEPKAAA